MKYLVVESAIAGAQWANLITPKDEYNEASMLFHQIRASQLANEKVTYGLAMIIDETGRTYECEMHGVAR